MSQRKINCGYPGCSSTFRTIAHLASEEVSGTLAGSEADELNISECSSASDGLKQEDQSSPLQITGYSSTDENSCSFNGSIMDMRPIQSVQKSRSIASVSKHRRLSQSRKVKPNLKTGRQKKNKSFETSGVLSPRSTNTLNVSPSGMGLKTSPWQKVRRDFQNLRCSSSRRAINTADVATEHSSDPETNPYLDDIEYASSPSPVKGEKCSQAISTPSTWSQPSNTPPTELDLFVALIEREARAANKTPSKSAKRRRRCRKGGYLYGLLHAVEVAKIDRKFLEHDKNFGLHIGVRLSVLRLETSFGVHLATVRLKSAGDPHIVSIIVAPELAQQLKVGSLLEAFFGSEVEPYRISWQQYTAIPMFVQPYKLLLLR